MRPRLRQRMRIPAQDCLPADSPRAWRGPIGAATAYALEQQRRREEEEAPAAAFNASQRAMDAAGLSTKHHLPVIEYDGPPPAAAHPPSSLCPRRPASRSTATGPDIRRDARWWIFENWDRLKAEESENEE